MYEQAYIDYLIYFHCDRDYFECHEILEEHWKKDPPTKRKNYWVGLIQIAVGLYHHRRGNFAGAAKMISNAIKLLKNEQHDLQRLGLHKEELIKQLLIRKNEILDGKCYYSFNLPIIDQELVTICKTQCHDQKNWGNASDFTNEYLIHKHTKRDRTDIIEERKNQLELRKSRKTETP
ncbi:hypothetical protein WQ54_06245 [Bacillus sp. SA1-12]|uniref:DUF309 domain-containing protein n=1 Tax=Bacillus sp. SA1-12 TaxID=1455638 RepID=UPI000625C50E|nr:DUF309 domain-containing protein [Bacillus sp. SA1-12]KKI93103.1 hypothetical protein WQ54_06245 [Bacillus sp. SA1-12]